MYKITFLTIGSDVSVTWYQQCHQLHHCIYDIKIIKMRQTWLLWLSDAISTSISITSCQWHHQYHHCFYLVKIIEMRYNMPFSSCDIFGAGIAIMWCWWHCVYCYWYAWSMLMVSISGLCMGILLPLMHIKQFGHWYLCGILGHICSWHIICSSMVNKCCRLLRFDWYVQ